MQHIDLNQDWQLRGFAPHEGLARKAYAADFKVPADAMAVTLPITAQAALFEHGRLPDPFVGTNADLYKDAEDREWWYFRDLDVPELTAGQTLWLRLEGVTYRAEVWINGQLAGRVEGMFRLDEFDVTTLVEPGRTNRIVIRTRTQEDASLDDRGSDARHKVRSQGVVAQAMYRWNWCPHLVNVGLWRPVSLIVRDPVEVEAVKVRTVRVDVNMSGDESILNTPDAELELSFEVSNRSDTDADASLQWTLTGVEGNEEEAAAGRETLPVPAGERVTHRRTVHLKDARLWWCNGLGDAHLYRLTATLDDRPHPATATFGVRQIEWVDNDDRDDVTAKSGHTARPWTMIGEPYPWVLRLNDRRVFLKGSNWVHADLLLRLDAERYDRLLAPAKHGGLNFLRVWGGSLAETDEFYDACDRLGILCWQEFWLACENYPALDRGLLSRCAADTVQRLYNHPSLVFYSGGNEFEPDNDANRSAVDALAAVVERHDPHRGFRRGSPYKGDKHGGLIPTPRGIRNKYLDILPGDKRQVLFRSEVATGRSAPMFASLERFLPDAWPLDEALFRHFFGVPFEFLSFAREYAADDGFEPAVFANHLAHARILQVNLEYCRTQMFRCGGHLNWQYSVPWPCLHREIVDTWGVPKPAFYGYANACRPLALFVDLERYLFHPGETVQLPVHLVNDGPRESDLECEITVYDAAGNPVFGVLSSATAEANTARRYCTMDVEVAPEHAGRSLLIFSTIHRDGELLFQNAYWVAVSNHRHEPDALNLDGTWRRADGSAVELPGNDMRQGDDGFESLIARSIEIDFEQAGETRAPGSEEAGQGERAGWVSYRRTFTVPDALRGRPLELFGPGFDASWEVEVNSRRLARYDLRPATLDLAAMAQVPYGQTTPQAQLDDGTDYRFFSDPITLPRVEPCFADVPADVLDLEGENTVVLRLKTTSQKLITSTLELRPVTENRDEVRHHIRRGKLFGDLRRMPEADVRVTEDAGRLTLHNAGAPVAVMVLVEVEAPGDDPASIPTDVNALFLQPGQSVTVAALDGGRFPDGAAVTVRGWNVAKRTMTIGGGT